MKLSEKGDEVEVREESQEEMPVLERDRGMMCHCLFGRGDGERFAVAYV